jgi:hypothetical protein
MRVYICLMGRIAEIRLNRDSLDLTDRGGFEARWVEDGDAIDIEVFRHQLKSYLNELYKTRYGQDAPTVTLNLASHQLLDDVMGWGRLNAHRSAIGE